MKTVARISAARVFMLQILVPALLTLALGLSGCSLPFLAKTLTDLQKVEGQFSVAAEAVDTLVNFAAPEYGPLVKAISGEIKSDLGELNQVLSTYRQNLQGVTSGDLAKIRLLFRSVQSKLPKILPALHVADPESVRYADAVVGTITTVLGEIGLLLPGNTSAGVRSLSRSNAPAKIITESQLRKQFNGAQKKARI